MMRRMRPTARVTCSSAKKPNTIDSDVQKRRCHFFQRSSSLCSDDIHVITQEWPPPATQHRAL
jgi:hypothetical protein